MKTQKHLDLLDVARQGIVTDLVASAMLVNALERKLEGVEEERTLTKVHLMEARDQLRSTTRELANHDSRRRADK